MKRFNNLYYFFLFFLVITSCDKSRIILNPDFEKFSLDDARFGIDKIELTDSATIFDITLYNVPGFWVGVSPAIKLKGWTTEKEYHLKWMEGLAPDIMMHVDSTGFYSTKLFFEPVDDKDTQIDFVEEGRTVVKGIKLSDNTRGRIKTNLSGTLNAMGASWLLLYQKSPGPESKTYVVPVRNGKFNYDIFTDEPLIFNVYIGKENLEGDIEGYPQFWSEGGEIKINFKNESSNDFTIEGGFLTQELTNLRDRQKLFKKSLYEDIPFWKQYIYLIENQKFYIPEYYSLKLQYKNSTVGWQRNQLFRKILNLHRNDSVLTPEARIISNEIEKFMESYSDSLYKLENEFFFKEYNKPSLSGLYRISECVRNSYSNIDLYLEWFNKYYIDTFTNHSYYKYVKEISDLLAPIEGNHFVNVTLPDKTGKSRTLNEFIDGKLAVLNIYSDNCTSCKNKLDSIIPLYKKYKAQGFDVVSIVLSTDSADKESKFKQIKNYPWNELIDSPDKSGAWRKYRMWENNFKTFLINNSGEIEKINPSANEIANFLRNHLE